jgi:hypothetical protein
MAELEVAAEWLGEVGYRPLAYGGRYRLFVRGG